jgi:hypothetical protein
VIDALTGRLQSICLVDEMRRVVKEGRSLLQAIDDRKRLPTSRSIGDHRINR